MGGKKRKETRMTQTLAWAAEGVLVPFIGTRKEVQPEIPASHVFCLKHSWNNPMDEHGPAAQKDDRTYMRGFGCQPAMEAKPENQAISEGWGEQEKDSARVIREARQRAGRERVVKKKKKQIIEVGARPRKECLSVWDAKKFSDKARNRFTDFRTFRTTCHGWHFAGQFHHRRPLIWREN